MKQIQTQLLLTPSIEQLRFLPEGPYPYQSDQLSWVAIQHGANDKVGSLNLLHLQTLENRTIQLPGRPGFAFPTSDENIFIAGVEKHVCRIDLQSGSCTPISEPIDTGIWDTIINDGVAFDEGIIFGSKHLSFSKPIASLFFWSAGDGSVTPLRGGQTCSNGKIIEPRGDGWSLLDIDTPTKRVVRYRFDADERQLTLDGELLRLDAPEYETRFPDGMVATPNGNVIIAFYDASDTIDYGVAREYNLRTGEVVTEWRCPDSPRVTCPQLIHRDGAIQLVLTTADEGMDPQLRALRKNAGCLFVGETEFSTAPPTPTVRL